MSERTQHDFDIAMMEGSLSIRNGNVFFLGSGGSGKSHTLAAILDEDPPSLRQSTPCVQKSIRTMAQCKVGVSGARFVRIKDDEYSDMLTTTAKQCQPAPSAAAATTAVSTLPPTAEELQIAVSRNDPVSSEDADKSTAKQESSGDDAPKKKTKRHKSGFEMELLRRMQALPKAPVDLYDKDLVDMRDSGGQTSFHEVLPIFVKNTTFGILTVKLNESLKAHPMVEYYTDGKPIGDPFKSHFTHLQTFRHCMRVLQSTCDSKSCPKLVFVGTHKDLEHECKPKESRQLKNAELRKIIPPAMKDSIIYCGDSLEELIHAVNVKNPGDEDREVISRLRELMIKELEKIPNKKIPLRYVALENAFLRQAKYKRKAVLSKEECFEIAKAFHFTRESLEAALEYLHSLKLIFYYKEVLPDVVFIDVQALLDKITELVKFCLSKSSRKITITGSVEEFVAYGIITLELLSQFQSHYVPNVFTEKELILVFKYLRILAEVGQGKYLVPCLLKLGDILPPTVLVAVNTIPALLFYFGPDGPKLGVYCCLVASLITDAKWELMTDNDRPVQLSRNQVQFMLPGDDPGAITITDPFSSYFHVSVDFPKHVSAEKAAEICRKICSSIRETILAGIRKASRSLNYNNSIPKIAFPCSVHEATELHPAVVSDSGLLTCTAHRSSACSEMTDQHKLWLGTADTGVYYVENASINNKHHAVTYY